MLDKTVYLKGLDRLPTQAVRLIDIAIAKSTSPALPGLKPLIPISVAVEFAVGTVLSVSASYASPSGVMNCRGSPSAN